MTNAKYRCSDCKLFYKKDEKKWERRRVAAACDFERKIPVDIYTPEFSCTGNPKINYYTCIGNYFFNQWAKLINFYPDYSKGVLPFVGGAFDMPAKFVDVMDLVHNLIEEDKSVKERNGS